MLTGFHWSLRMFDNESKSIHAAHVHPEVEACKHSLCSYTKVANTYLSMVFITIDGNTSSIKAWQKGIVLEGTDKKKSPSQVLSTLDKSYNYP